MITILLRTKDGWEKRVPVHPTYIMEHREYVIRQRVGPHSAWISEDAMRYDSSYKRHFRQTFADMTVYEEI